MDEQNLCSQCGEIHKKCKGHKKRKNSADGKLHPCGKNPATGKLVCDKHGGESLAGEDHGRYRTGRYINALPPKYRRTFNETVNDPKFNHLVESVSLLDSQIEELFLQLDQGETGEKWRRLKSQIKSCMLMREKLARLLEPILADAIAVSFLTEDDKEYKKYLQAVENEKEAFLNLVLTVEMHPNEEKVWDRVNEITELRAKVVQVDNKRAAALSKTVTAEQMFGLIAYISKLIIENVSDKDQIRAVQRGIDRALRDDSIIDVGVPVAALPPAS